MTAKQKLAAPKPPANPPTAAEWHAAYEYVKHLYDRSRDPDSPLSEYDYLRRGVAALKERRDDATIAERWTA